MGQIHTDLRDNPGSQRARAFLPLLLLAFIAALGGRADGQRGHLYAANILPPNPAGKSCEVWSPVAVPDCQVHLGEFLGALEEELSRTRTAHLVDDLQEQAILVSVSRQSHADQEEWLGEPALPRLTGRGTAMSRLAGGIGGRGPGETKLEVDRRRVRDRISHLEKQMEALAWTRMQQRARRLRRAVPIISIVGYTNAGKSTLLNVLTRSRVTANNRLFETLDTASRRLR